jgi:hypothetical protein
MSAFYNKSSPYYNTEIVNGYLDLLELRDLPTEADDILFEITATYERRPDLLAYDLYKDSKLWWVFAVRNKKILKDPVYDMRAGTKIRLPKLSTLRNTLGL